jgi:hypothetical protein
VAIVMPAPQRIGGRIAVALMFSRTYVFEAFGGRGVAFLILALSVRWP